MEASQKTTLLPKRQRRSPIKTCRQCRESKVRCDRNRPCSSCVRRGYGDLCSFAYHESLPPDIARSGLPDATNVCTSPKLERNDRADENPDDELVFVSQEHWDRSIAELEAAEQAISNICESISQAKNDPLPVRERLDEIDSLQRHVPWGGPGVSSLNTLGVGSVYLGSGSALAFIAGTTRTPEGRASDLFGNNLLSALGLENTSATYPFVDLWASNPLTSDVGAMCVLIPDDQKCKRLFTCYRDVGAVLSPVILELQHLEDEIGSFLCNRLASRGQLDFSKDTLTPVFGKSLGFLGLLFAVLASGYQFSDFPNDERFDSTHTYVSCAYHCLRLANFMALPTTNAIQTLLIISSVLSYNTEPGVSYLLVGIAERMSVTLGLHVHLDRLPQSVQSDRLQVWWATALQNADLTLAFDRPCITPFIEPEIPFHPESRPGSRSYFESLCSAVSLSLEILRARMQSPSDPLSVHVIETFLSRIKQILTDALPHLRSRKYCTSSTDYLQRSALQLHLSYLSSVITQPASTENSSQPGDTEAIFLREAHVESLVDVVKAFLELHSIHHNTSRSWLNAQHAVTSSYLLAVNEKTRSDPQVRDLVEKLEQVLVLQVGQNPRSNMDHEWPLASLLSGLQKLETLFASSESESEAHSEAEASGSMC